MFIFYSLTSCQVLFFSPIGSETKAQGSFPLYTLYSAISAFIMPFSHFIIKEIYNIQYIR